jgi:hypothetical protein
MSCALMLVLDAASSCASCAIQSLNSRLCKSPLKYNLCQVIVLAVVVVDFGYHSRVYAAGSFESDGLHLVNAAIFLMYLRVVIQTLTSDRDVPSDGDTLTPVSVVHSPRLHVHPAQSLLQTHARIDLYAPPAVFTRPRRSETGTHTRHYYTARRKQQNKTAPSQHMPAEKPAASSSAARLYGNLCERHPPAGRAASYTHFQGVSWLASLSRESLLAQTLAPD